MNFRTYGPFELSDMSPAGVDQLFDKFRTVDENLGEAIGIYIVAAPDNSGNLIPWYVGKTDDNFGKRLCHHLDSERFHKIMRDSGTLSIFLIPRVTPSGKLKKATQKMKESGGVKSISRLEFKMIGDCLLSNSELLNKSERTFHAGMHVPGYWNDDPKNRDFSAKELARMLKTKSKARSN